MNYYYDGSGYQKDYAQAIKWYRLAAEQGNAVAQNGLGECLYYGYGITKDIPEAARLFNLAADQGLPIAMYNLGQYYEHEKDNELALQWYQFAESQGITKAWEKLANFYYYGKVGDPDLEEAAKWYQLSCDDGNDNSCKRLDSIKKEIILTNPE